MSGVIQKFFVASMAMWMAPLAIIYAFYHQLLPGSSRLSSSSQTLVSGFLAVVSVNLVIGAYICMAMREEAPRQEAQPDAAFLAQARASIAQPASSSQASRDDGGDGQVKGKVE